MNVPTPVLLDTDVFTQVVIRRNQRRRPADEKAAHWRNMLSGRRILISFQTRAEVLQGGIANNWGEPHMRALGTILDSTPTVMPDAEIIRCNAQLFADCRQQGHALQDKIHTGDRWIAACAIAKEVPLLSGDGIFNGVPGLLIMA